MLNPDQIIKNAGEIYFKFKYPNEEELCGHDLYISPNERQIQSRQVKAAIIAICEELNKENKYSNGEIPIN